MRPIAIASLMLVFVVGALVPSSAYADRGGGTHVDCPICEKEIWVPYTSYWPRLGYIQELGPEVTNFHARPYRVWTCPNCHYSNWSGKFKKGVKKETKKRILAGLEAPAPRDKRGVLPIWAGYVLAAQILEWDGASPGDRGSILIAGAWAVRTDADNPFGWVRGDVALDARFRKALDATKRRAHLAPIPEGEQLLWWLAQREAHAAAAEREAAIAREAGKPDPILDLAAAFLHRRMGENEVATRILAQMKDPATPAALRGAAKALADSMSKERALQERALPLLLEGAQAPSARPWTRAWTRITVGDTLRRLGRVPEARRFFIEAVKDLEAPAWAVALARHGLVKTGAKEEDLDALRAAESRAQEALRKQLLNPETADRAARLVGDLADATFFPNLLAALAHERWEVRAAAMLALCRMDELDLPSALVAALGRLALDESELPRIRSLAMSRLAREAASASLPVFRAGLDTDRDDFRDDAVGGLARCGEAEDVPRLLAITARGRDEVQWHERRDALLALSCLANRELTDAKEAATWWASAKRFDRVTWVLKGFRDAGVEIALPSSRESLPALLELLDVGCKLDRPWVTWNAQRMLRAITGQRFGWDAHTNVWGTQSRRRRHEQRPLWIEAWHAWWAAQRAEPQKPPK